MPPRTSSSYIQAQPSNRPGFQDRPGGNSEWFDRIAKTWNLGDSASSIELAKTMLMADGNGMSESQAQMEIQAFLNQNNGDVNALTDYSRRKNVEFLKAYEENGFQKQGTSIASKPSQPQRSERRDPQATNDAPINPDGSNSPEKTLEQRLESLSGKTVRMDSMPQDIQEALKDSYYRRTFNIKVIGQN